MRYYKKKRPDRSFQEGNMKSAMEAVLKGMKVRAAATKFGVPHTTLYYRIKQQGKQKENFSSKHTFRQVFTSEQEDDLVQCSKNLNELSYKTLQKLAFEFAISLKRECPPSWSRNQLAGIDWVQGFIRRHPLLTLRKPAKTSLAHATDSHETNVREFQENLAKVLQKHPFTPDRIIYLDETSISIVTDAPKVVAQEGENQVGQIPSAERCTLVTMVAIVSAAGNSLPPAFVFPRKKINKRFMVGSPPGSIGLVNNNGSGWMTSALFPDVLEHVKKITHSTKEHPILILMDNHDSHVCLEAILYAKQNGIVFVTMLESCSRKLQPLFVTIMAPLEEKLKVAQNDWLLTNPGKAITIYEVTSLANTAITSSFTIGNIVSGFERSGIWPFNRNKFIKNDFIPTITVANATTYRGTSEIPETSSVARAAVRTTPEPVRPYPKASPKRIVENRRKAKSQIVTDTPEKERIEEVKRQKTLEVRKAKNNTDIESNDEFSELPLAASSGRPTVDEDDSEREVSPEAFFDALPVIEVGSWVVVEFSSKKGMLYHIGKVTEEKAEHNEVSVKFLKKGSKSYVFPAIQNESSVKRPQIKKNLSEPVVRRGQYIFRTKFPSTLTFV